MRYVLCLVFYPDCNQGIACRTMVDVFHTFEALWDIATNVSPIVYAEDTGNDSPCGEPAWDYIAIP